MVNIFRLQFKNKEMQFKCYRFRKSQQISHLRLFKTNYSNNDALIFFNSLTDYLADSKVWFPYSHKNCEHRFAYVCLTQDIIALHIIIA